jgi:serine protease AprX
VLNDESYGLADFILKLGSENGIEIDQIRERGITGKSVKVAIIDQNLAGDHPEFEGRILEYIDMGCDKPPNEGSMHGPAVLSIIAGQSLGIAPGVEVYYYAFPSWKGDASYATRALLEIIEKNKTLPVGDRIRIVSVSAAPGGIASPFRNGF